MTNRPKSAHKQPASVKRTARLAETAFHKLQSAILSGDFREGEVVRVSRLARQWGIGRTPMRGAVMRAAECGFLVLRPNHAPVVRKLTADDIRHIYSLRELLECFALKKAWSAIDRSQLSQFGKFVAQVNSATDSRKRLRAQFLLDQKLHQLWITRCGNPWLSSILERLFIYRPNLVDCIIDHTQFSDQAFEEHKVILKAIKRGSLHRATALLARHIRRSALNLVALLK